MSSRPSNRFPLTRYFVLTSLVAAVLVGAGLAFHGARKVKRELLSANEAQAVRIARHLNSEVHQEFIHPTIAADGYVDLTTPKHLAALDRVVRAAIAEFGVVSVYFFDRKGVITYATTHAHIGFPVPPNNPNYQRAARGEISSVVVRRGDPLDVSNEPQEVTLLETYVPALQLDAAGASTGRQGGVIEIYQDATGLMSDVRAASVDIALFSVLGILLLTLALWLWIRKAEQAIDERSRLLEEANAALAELSADLERQVEDRTRRLVRAETLAGVGTLSAGVAHEVNNPIAAIASCAEGLLRRASADDLVAQPDFELFPEYLEIIRDEAFRVKEITRNLLDFSRSGHDASEPVDLGAILASAAKLVDHRVEQEQKQLALSVPDAPLVIQGDPAGLRQLVLNLTVNAIDACPAGGQIRWSVSGGEGARSGGGATLTCDDDGPGFAADELERAFEPFFTSKPTGRGTGLGLSIAHGIARRHGGSIELSNRPGGGARVTVLLQERRTDDE